MKNFDIKYPFDQESCRQMGHHRIATAFVIEHLIRNSFLMRYAFAECGVSRGHNLIVMDKILQGRKSIYAFDTFNGLPYEENTLKKHECCCSLEDFENNLKEAGVKSVIPVKGLIEDTLAAYSKTLFSFVFLDMDLGKSTQFAVDFFEDRVVKEGIIGFHDYGFERTLEIKPIVDKLDKTKWRQFGPILGNAIFFERL